jgi:hypothetical protein
MLIILFQKAPYRGSRMFYNQQWSGPRWPRRSDNYPQPTSYSENKCKGGNYFKQNSSSHQETYDTDTEEDHASFKNDQEVDSHSTFSYQGNHKTDPLSKQSYGENKEDFREAFSNQKTYNAVPSGSSYVEDDQNPRPFSNQENHKTAPLPRQSYGRTRQNLPNKEIYNAVPTRTSYVEKDQQRNQYGAFSNEENHKIVQMPRQSYVKNKQDLQGAYSNQETYNAVPLKHAYVENDQQQKQYGAFSSKENHKTVPGSRQSYGENKQDSCGAFSHQETYNSVPLKHTYVESNQQRNQYEKISNQKNYETVSVHRQYYGESRQEIDTFEPYSNQEIYKTVPASTNSCIENDQQLPSAMPLQSKPRRIVAPKCRKAVNTYSLTSLQNSNPRRNLQKPSTKPIEPVLIRFPTVDLSVQRNKSPLDLGVPPGFGTENQPRFNSVQNVATIGPPPGFEMLAPNIVARLGPPPGFHPKPSHLVPQTGQVVQTDTWEVKNLKLDTAVSSTPNLQQVNRSEQIQEENTDCNEDVPKEEIATSEGSSYRNFNSMSSESSEGEDLAADFSSVLEMESPTFVSSCITVSPRIMD